MNCGYNRWYSISLQINSVEFPAVSKVFALTTFQSAIDNLNHFLQVDIGIRVPQVPVYLINANGDSWDL